MTQAQLHTVPQKRLRMPATLARRYDTTPVRHGKRTSATVNLEPEGTKTVLVVDDKGPLRKAIVEVLHQGGYRVLEASGVLGAQRIADSHRNIRLLLADFSAPETAGLDLARWFQVRYPQTKILLTTGSLWELLYRTGEHEQFGILVKPFSGDELKRMVHLLATDA
jgi:CheY-like chemotaxis protein